MCEAAINLVRTLPDGLPRPLLEALEAMGRAQPFSHQRETVELVRQGRDVLLVTSTASGKTLAFNTAILDLLLREPDGHALYLYPIERARQRSRAGPQGAHIASAGDVSATRRSGDETGVR